MNFLLKLLLPLALIVFVARWVIQRVGDFGGAAVGVAKAGGQMIKRGHEKVMRKIEAEAGAWGQARGAAAAGQRFSEITTSAKVESVISALQGKTNYFLAENKKQNIRVILQSKPKNINDLYNRRELVSRIFPSGQKQNVISLLKSSGF